MLTDFSQELCGCIADINNIHVYLLLLRYEDSENGFIFGVQPQNLPLTRSLICTFQGRDWYVLNQGVDIMSIVSLALSETDAVEAYASSGSDFTQLLINPADDVTWILKTALSAHGNLIINKRCIRAGAAVTAWEPNSIAFLVESEHRKNTYTLKAALPIVWRNAAHDIITFVNNSNSEIQFMLGPGFAVAYVSAESYGHVLGATMWSTSNSMSINAVLMEYIDADLWAEQPGPRQ
jgi:hypothetical protein